MAASPKHNTGIEWTQMPGRIGETWNPVVGCSVVSPGCTNCYAMGMAARIERMAAGAGRVSHYAGTTKASKAGPVWTGRIAQAGEKALTAPLRWAKPRAVFVNSMGDLFHENVPDAWIDEVFAVMALCPQHIFMILTKRAARMRAYFIGDQAYCRVLGDGVVDALETAGIPWNGDWEDRHSQAIAGATRWPLPNVWLGVSVEDQTRADERIPELLATPAAIRFISAEPLLGPLDLEAAWHGENALDSECWGDCGWCERGFTPLHNCQRGKQSQRDVNRNRSGLDWVIAGGESGKGARPMHPDWARGLRDQCRSAGVPFFFKQWGEWANRGRLFDPRGDTEETVAAEAALDEYFIELEDGTDWHDPDRLRLLDRNGHNWANDDAQPPPCVHVMTRIGKRAAGHQLDGETHHNWPEVGS
ncbi:MAG: DUF5131 family protein [Glycocaulis sp.]